MTFLFFYVNLQHSLVKMYVFLYKTVLFFNQINRFLIFMRLYISHVHIFHSGQNTIFNQILD